MNHNTTTIWKGKVRANQGKRGKTFVQVCLILVIVAFLFVRPGAVSSVLADDDTIHIVKPGESLSSIAARYGLSVIALARYNNIVNINLLRVNQVLRIPGESIAPAPAQPIYLTPTRVTRDIVYKPGSEATPAPTQVVFNYPTPTSTPIVATATPLPPRIRVHIVVSFETLTTIGYLYGTTPTAIKNRNGLPSDRIYRGQRLIIP